jgi:hypothetical protein
MRLVNLICSQAALQLWQEAHENRASTLQLSQKQVKFCEFLLDLDQKSVATNKQAKLQVWDENAFTQPYRGCTLIRRRGSGIA